MDSLEVVFRPARPQDQDTIRELVKRERLNPTGLDWPHFVVAVHSQSIVGAVQLRQHRDGARELGSLVVTPPLRGQGIARRMIELLLASHTGPVYMITDQAHAAHYRLWRFQPVTLLHAPQSVRLNYLMGSMAMVISLVKRLPSKRLVILARTA